MNSLIQSHCISDDNPDPIFGSAEDLLPGMLFVRNLPPDLSFVRVGSGAVGLTGYQAEDLAGADGFSLIHPVDLPGLIRVTGEAWESGGNYRAEYRFKHRDGEWHHIRESGRVLRDAGGIARSLCGIATDITELCAAVGARTEAEIRFRGLFENAVEGIFRTTLDGAYLDVNPALAGIYGYECPADLIAKLNNIGTQLYVESGRRDHFVRLMLRFGVVEKFESEVFRCDGSRIWVSENARVVRGMDGGVLCFEGTVVDITDRKAAIARLAAETGMLRALIDHWPDVIYAKDADGVYTLSNLAHTRLLGMSRPEEVEGKRVGDFFLPERAREIETEERHVLETGVAVLNRQESRPGGTSAQQCWVLVSKIPLRDAASRPVGLLCVTRDISENKRLEQQFHQSQKMEAIGRLAGGVAHDFNNILTAILGYSELIGNDPALPTGLRGGLQEINAGALRAAALTGQLLAFSRKQTVEPTPINLNDVMLKLEKMLHRLIGENIALRSRLDAGLPLAKADRGQMEQVIVNMVVNSRDAMPKGGHLTIETRAMDLDAAFVARYPDLKPGPHVRISITDDGVGIPREIQQNIFEPFFTTKGQGKGTGLGLATSYGIIKQNGGHVTVYSEPGSGTTFNIYLPACDEAEDSGDVGPERSLSPSGTETVLLVEDDQTVRSLNSSILSGLGYKVIPAADGREALEILINKNLPSIEVLFTDVIMPHVGGRELAEKLHEISPGTKVLFTSGYNEEAIHHQGLIEDQCAFLQKPFSPAALGAVLRDLLDRRKSEA